MLIVRHNEREARKAIFVADRDRLFGGQHLTKGTMWATVCPILGTYSSQRVEPSDWEGS
jgi:hypothetical protein